MEKIKTYEQAVKFINEIGFMPLSKNKYGYISLEEITNTSLWHSDTIYDPWIWKNKIASEKKAAYTKIFSHKPMFISWEWYPVFLSYFRSGQEFEVCYQDGKISYYASLIYQLLKENGKLNTHSIKKLLDVDIKKSGFDKALVELQEKMFITVCGASKRINKQGNPYGWFITDYILVRDWVDEDIYNRQKQIDNEEAEMKIKEHIQKQVPGITTKKIERFIGVRL